MRRWVTLILLTAGLIIAYVDRTNLSVALAAPEFRNFFQLTDEQRGFVNSAFFWSYTLLQIPAGLFVDRFGVKLAVTLALLLWCGASAATGSASVLWQLIGLRLLLGVGESVIFPAGLCWIHRNVEERRRGLAAGIFVSGTKWGPALGAPLAAWLISHFGWQSMFRAIGLGGLVWLLPWVLFAREGSCRAKPSVAAAVLPPVSFPHLMRSRVIWGTMIGTFCYNYFLFF